ncbi:RHS repeat-associated core domain-containing protein [Rhodanobacter denitrificans]|nr:RHS repeat-associated core domain-containing protein [Rhodanobacter denitrificans]
MKRNAIRSVMALLAVMFFGIAHAGTHHYYYTDPQGTVLAKADAQGNIIATYDYAPYGQPVTSMSGSPNGPGYTGHVNDPETGLVYMQARYYDPAVGRFLSVDPVGPTPGNIYSFNRYAYANNNPIGNIDPDGRQSRAAGKQLGRALHAAWVSKGDGKKYDAIMAGYREQDRQDLNVALGLTELGIVKDAVEITITTVNGGDATAQGSGAIGGEIAGQIAKKVVARKISEPAAEAVAAIAGQIVGDVVETAVEQSQEKNSADGADGAPPETPLSRPPPPPPVTDFYD